MLHYDSHIKVNENNFNNDKFILFNTINDLIKSEGVACKNA